MTSREADYAINLLLFRLGREPELVARMREEPSTVFAELGVTPEEGELILRRDGRALYDLERMRR